MLCALLIPATPVIFASRTINSTVQSAASEAVTWRSMMSALTFGNYVGDVRASAGRQPAAAAVARCRPGPVAYPLHPVQLSHAGCDDCAGGRPAGRRQRCRPFPSRGYSSRFRVEHYITAWRRPRLHPSDVITVRPFHLSVRQPSTACSHDERLPLTCCTYIHLSFICSIFFCSSVFFVGRNFELPLLDVISPEVTALYVCRYGAVVASSTLDRSTSI